MRNEKLAALIKEYSRMKFGRKRVFVDQEIEDRIGIVRAPTDGQTGAPPPPADPGLSAAAGG